MEGRLPGSCSFSYTGIGEGAGPTDKGIRKVFSLFFFLFLFFKKNLPRKRMRTINVRSGSFAMEMIFLFLKILPLQAFLQNHGYSKSPDRRFFAFKQRFPLAFLFLTPLRAFSYNSIQSGQAGEFHPHLPTEPCMRLSPHTALHVGRSHGKYILSGIYR